VNPWQCGDRVCATKWGGTFTGTVIGVTGTSVFVHWDGLAVDDELDPEDVRLLDGEQ
jgi:hypothetical protein